MNTIKKTSRVDFAFFISVIVSLMLLWVVPKWQARDFVNNSKEQFELENSARSTLIQALGGLFFFVTAYFTWRNFQVSEGKETADRFEKAISLLSSEQPQSRIGGIYLLEKISQDSPKDQSLVMEIIASYLRQNTSNTNNFESTGIDQETQAALTVLARRDPKNDLELVNLRNLNLKRSYLVNACLTGVELDGSDLSYSNLQNANFSGASALSCNLAKVNLPKARFKDSIVDNASFNCANLYAADFNQAYLNEADFSGANLSNALLERARIRGANFTGSQLWGTDLRRVYDWYMDANFEKATYTHETKFPTNFSPENKKMILISSRNKTLKEISLSKASLCGAAFEEFNLIGIDFSGANLRHANMKNCNMVDVTLVGSDLSKASLENSVLTNVDFSDADLSNTDFKYSMLKDVTWNAKTNWIDAKNLEFAKEVPEILKQVMNID